MSYLKAQICAFLSKSKEESPETFGELVVMEQQDADFADSMQGKAINLFGTIEVPGLTKRGEFALLQEEFFWDHTENVDSKEGEEALEEIKDELKRAQEYLKPLATNKNKPLKLVYHKICDSLQEEDFTGNRIGEYMKEIEGTYGDEGMYDGDLAPDSEYSKSLEEKYFKST